MTLAQITGIIRAVLAAACGGLIAKNVVTTDQITQAAESISTLLSLAIFVGTTYWSWRSNHSSNLASQLSVSTQPLAEQISKAGPSK